MAELPKKLEIRRGKVNGCIYVIYSNGYEYGMRANHKITVSVREQANAEIVRRYNAHDDDQKKIDDLLVVCEDILECPIPIEKSRITENGHYLGTFEIYGNCLESLKQAIAQAKKKE